jgi:hypothetical protein
MKKIYLIVIYIFISIGCCHYVFADETGWDQIMTDYDKNRIDKPVTQQEFDKAIQDVKKFEKKKKKKQIKKEAELQENVPNFTPQLKYDKSIEYSENLLRLPVSIVHNGNTIKDGFYLAKRIKDNDTFYLLIQQGNTVYKINMQRIENNDDRELVKTEIIDNKYLKITYQDFLYTLINYFPIIAD